MIDTHTQYITYDRNTHTKKQTHLYKHTNSHLHLHRQTHTHTHTHTHRSKFTHSQTHTQAYRDMHKEMNMFDWGIFRAVCRGRGGGQELSAQVIRAELN